MNIRTRTIMKKTICILMLLSMIIVFSSCTDRDRIEGLENFSSYESSFETTKYLFPCEDFIDRFEYIDGDYYYDYWSNISYSRDKSFAYFVYTPEVYQEAMDFTLDHMSFLDENTYEFNGYTFVQRDVTELVARPRNFPEWFWMMFYSEERGVIGFFGYYSAIHLIEIRPDEDFEGFIRHEFPEYDWDA